MILQTRPPISANAGYVAVPGRRGLKPIRVAAIYVLSLLLYGTILSLFQNAPIPVPALLLALLIAALCFLPMALWYLRNQQRLPMFELICLSYALQYSAALWLQPNQIVLHSLPVRFSWDETIQALQQTAIGIAAMLAGYYAVWRSKVSQTLLHIDLPLHPERRSLYFVLATIAGFIGVILQFVFTSSVGGSAFGAIIQLGTYQLYIVITLLAYQVYAKGSSAKRYGIALYSITAIAALAGLVSGLLENAFVPLVILFVVRWHSRRKLPVLAIFVAVSLFAILNSVKLDYRAQTWYGNSDSSLSNRITLWYNEATDAVGNILSGDLFQGLTDTVHKSTGRLDLLHVLDLVNRVTPQYVPFYQGETYSYLLFAWVPRLLWPDKPVATDANVRVALDYNILDPTQVGSTTVGIGQIAEAYANFGVVGILIIMALQGLVLASLDRLLNQPDSEGGRAIYLALMVYFLNGIGTATAPLFGALIQNVIASAVLVRMFSLGWQSRQGMQAKEQLDRMPQRSKAGMRYRSISSAISGPSKTGKH